MAIVHGGLFSLRASGAIGKALVFSDWKGRPYARQYVIPKNPRSTAQTSTRDTFKWTHDIFKRSPGIFQAPWNLLAQGQPLTGQNSFLTHNIPVLRGQANLNAIVMCDGAKGGIPPASIALTPGASDISTAWTNPAPPVGWTLVSATVCWIKDQTPAGETSDNMFAHSVASATSPYAIAGLTTGTKYQVGVFLVWTNSSGKTVYGAALQANATAA